MSPAALRRALARPKDERDAAGRTELLGGGEDSVCGIVVAYQDPDPSLAPAVREFPRVHAFRVRVRPRVGGVEYAEVQVADLALGAVLVQEVPTRNQAVEHSVRPRIVLPAEHLGIEAGRGGRIVGSEVNEDQGIGMGHLLRSSRWAATVTRAAGLRLDWRREIGDRLAHCAPR